MEFRLCDFLTADFNCHLLKLMFEVKCLRGHLPIASVLMGM